VLNFRLIRDRDSNKPKGYGFCEFKEKEYARSAIRNMNQAEFFGRSLRVDYSEKHRTALFLPEGPKQQNTLQDAISKLTTQEAMTLFHLLQQQGYCNEEEIFKIFKSRPYVLFSMLKLMHRINGECTTNKNSQEGLLPLPPEDHNFYPYYNMHGY
jgi:RNA recognition motif-containing protein